MSTLGIDIGGTYAKAGMVDEDTGELSDGPYVVKTPQNPSIDNVLSVLEQFKGHFDAQSRVGIAFPAVIKENIVLRLGRFGQTWRDVEIFNIFSRIFPGLSTVINDADAAGLGEVAYGEAKNCRGVVLCIVIGTGVGSALIFDGRLVPNTEFGYLKVGQVIAREVLSAQLVLEEGFSWHKWVKNFNEYVSKLENLLWPDLIILGGRIAQYRSQVSHNIISRAQFRFTRLGHVNGIVGAAWAANNQTTE